MTVVVDASVVVAGLASVGATGEWAESVLAGESLAAPHVMPVEAASILHRAELAGELSADAASLAHADLGRLRVEYFPYAPFAERIWELRAQGLAASISAFERVWRVFKPVMGMLPGSMGDPSETPHDADVLELYRLARGLSDAEATRTRVELQISGLLTVSEDLERRALDARAGGRADLADVELARKNSFQAELEEQRGQHQSLQEEERRLTVALLHVQAKIDAKRSRSEAAAASQVPYLSCYDAWYVALAEFLGVKLATLDARLARAPGPRCGFCLPPP